MLQPNSSERQEIPLLVRQTEWRLVALFIIDISHKWPLGQLQPILEQLQSQQTLSMWILDFSIKLTFKIHKERYCFLFLVSASSFFCWFVLCSFSYIRKSLEGRVYFYSFHSHNTPSNWSTQGEFVPKCVFALALTDLVYSLKHTFHTWLTQWVQCYCYQRWEISNWCTLLFDAENNKVLKSLQVWFRGVVHLIPDQTCYKWPCICLNSCFCQGTLDIFVVQSEYSSWIMTVLN